MVGLYSYPLRIKWTIPLAPSSGEGWLLFQKGTLLLHLPGSNSHDFYFDNWLLACLRVSEDCVQFSFSRFSVAFNLTLSPICFCRPSRRRRSVGVANATQSSFFLTTAPGLPFGSTTANPKDTDKDNEDSKVSNTSILCVTHRIVWMSFSEERFKIREWILIQIPVFKSSIWNDITTRKSGFICYDLSVTLNP